MYPRIEGAFILTAVTESGGHIDLVVPEAELLIACLQGALSAAPRCTDWRVLEALAETHGVLPLVHRALTATGADTPDDHFQRAVSNSQLSTETLAVELEQLLASFAQHGIDVIPLKGPVLAETLYGNIAMRPCEDLDLLVRVRDFGRAEKVLTDAGWVAPSPADELNANSCAMTSWLSCTSAWHHRDLFHLIWMEHGAELRRVHFVACRWWQCQKLTALYTCCSMD